MDTNNDNENFLYIRVKNGINITNDGLNAKNLQNKIRSLLPNDEKFSLKLGKYYLTAENQDSLTKYGFDFKDSFSFETGTSINLTFVYNFNENHSFKFNKEFSTCDTVFDIKKSLSKEIFNSSSNSIFLENEKLENNVKASELKNPVTIKLESTYSMYKVFFLDKKEIVQNFFLMRDGDTISLLKLNFANRHNFPIESIEIISDNDNITNNTKLADIKNHQVILNYSDDHIQDLHNSKYLELFDTGKTDKKSSRHKFFNKTKGKGIKIQGYFFDFYQICIYLENGINLDRIFTLHTSDEIQKDIMAKIELFKESYKSNDNQYFPIDFPIDSKYRVFFYNEGEKKNVEAYQFSFLATVGSLREFAFHKFNCDKNNFGIVINDHFADDNNYICQYAFGNTINVYLKGLSSIIKKINFKDTKFNFYASKKLSLVSAQRLIDPVHPLMVNFKSDKVIFENRIFKLETSRIIYGGLNDKSMSYQRSDNSLIYYVKNSQKKKEYYFNENDTIKDLIKRSKDTQSNKQSNKHSNKQSNKNKKERKTKDKKYTASSLLKHIQFFFYEKISQLHFDDEDDLVIEVKKETSNIQYKIFYINENQVKNTLNETDEVLHSYKTNKNPTLKCIEEIKKKFGIGSNTQISLFSDYVELKNEDNPFSCFPKYYYTINTKEDHKTLIFYTESDLISFKIEFQKSEYDTVSQKVSQKLNVDPSRIKYYCQSLDNSQNIEIPPSFSAAAFKNGDKIKISITPEIHFDFTFVLGTKKKTLNIYHNMEDLTHVCLFAQKSFDLLHFSPSLISLEFEDRKIQLDVFKYLSNKSEIKVVVKDQNSLTANVTLLDEKIEYKFKGEESIKIFKLMASTKYNIMDYNTIDVLDKNSKVISDINTKIQSNGSYTILIPTIDLFCKGSLGDETIKIPKIFSIKQAKEHITKKLNIDSASFGIYKQEFDDIYKEISISDHRNTEIREAFPPLSIQKSLSSLKFNIGKETIKFEISFPEDQSLECVKVYICSFILNFSFYFSATKDGKNKVPLNASIYQYMKKQKEIDPSSKQDTFYIFQDPISPQEQENPIPAKNCNINIHKEVAPESTKKVSKKKVVKSSDNKIELSKNKVEQQDNNNSNNNENKVEQQDNNNSNNNENKVEQQDNTNVHTQKDSQEPKSSTPSFKLGNQKQKVSMTPPNNTENLITYNFFNYEANKSYSLQLDNVATVEKAKDKLKFKCSAEPSHIELIFGGRKLADNLKLSSLHLRPQEVISVFLKSNERQAIRSIYHEKNERPNF